MRCSRIARGARSYFASSSTHPRAVIPLKSFIEASFTQTTRIPRAYSTSPKHERAGNLLNLSRVSHNDTIYAASTGPGRAGIAIIRISGPSCLEIYEALCPGKRHPKPRYATLRSLFDPSAPSNRNILDSDALILYFPAPMTVTGEEVLELHIHGGPATVRAVLGAIPRSQSSSIVRFAEPGEFTKRAFLNNRLDLAQVEALSDTLSAETEQQRLASVRGNSGVLGKTYEEWRHLLLYARGELEALIDFSEDQHFDESPVELLHNVTYQIVDISNSIRSHILASHRGELLRKGIRISLLGPPNAGKSSLLNRIVGREASIVSQEAGTTRDIVEVSLDIRGFLCTFADTAGLRQRPSQRDQAESPIGFIGDVEQEGMRRARLKAAQSDVVIVLTSVESSGKDFDICFDQEALEIAAKASASLVLLNKTDKISDKHHLSVMIETFSKRLLSLPSHESNLQAVIPISCKASPEIARSENTGNIDAFLDVLTNCFQDLTSFPVDEEDLLGVTERQRQLLVTCLEHLLDFTHSSTNTEECDIVLAAEHLRSAANCLARITGRGEAGDVEEVLGVVFEKFCVGK